MARYNLENKVAVITEGTHGVGLAIAEAFLQKGAKTAIIIGINEGDAVAKLNLKYGANKAVFIKCDVTKDLDAVSNDIFNKYKVDILVNNAGIGDDTSIRRTIETNTIAVIEWSQKFYEHMKLNAGGTIINIASRYGYQTDQFVPVYKACKFAVMGYSRTQGHLRNFDRSKVRVVVICPGFDTCFDNDYCEEVKMECEDFLKANKQPVEAVGRAAVEVYENADSGTAWLVSESKPIVQIN